MSEVYKYTYAVKKFRMHPQLSSLSKAVQAAKKAFLRDRIVLDCFCGTGVLLYAAFISGAKQVIGTDIENWSFYLYPKLRQIISYSFDKNKIILKWNIDAMESVNTFFHEILFIDPPNPFTLVGGCMLSTIRDLGMSGSDLHNFWKGKLNSKNMMGKHEAIRYLTELFLKELEKNIRIIANLFITAPHGRKKSLKKIFEDIGFKLKHISSTYYEIISFRR